ncbi:glycosyltransferase family 2 protein [Micromonospora echinofusca]|uniref:Glycosyltransferase n=1 Tax=Micromonospora echinofusca TaxID=47858 RepID=A0ABS3VJY3_MICEH|nr:glycosyltransferase family 2 protein [Micromonospora echinofusca]MBO4204841.1 glycosyltransferase [Micromonospora echinofusca]
MQPSVVVVPVHEPSRQLLGLLRELRQVAPGVEVVVVDDGSGPAAAPVLDEAVRLGAVVRRLGVNRGKGVALKEAFRYVRSTYPGRAVVCADADGQHRAPDVLRLAERVRPTRTVVLGVRRFEGDVPLRSRIGNRLTGLLFRAATGHRVQDTQTGLRAFAYPLLDWLTGVPGDRFDYEMNVLLQACRTGRPIDQVVVPTRYVRDNASSHFGVLADSARVWWPLLRATVGRWVGPRRPGT